MQIKCDSNDLLYFLVQNEIDEIDAKAIIYDLLSLPEGGLAEKVKKDKEEATRKSLIKAKKQREALKATEEEDEYEEEDEEDEEDEDEGEEDEEVAQVTAKPSTGAVAKTKIRKPKKRMDFGGFGGPAQPLR